VPLGLLSDGKGFGNGVLLSRAQHSGL